jgi:flagellar assembly protein FliH
MPAVRFAKPLTAASILTENAADGGVGASGASPSPRPGAEQNANMQGSEEQKTLYQDMCRMLQGAVAKLNELYDEIFAGHNEAVARLSVEIARKVLMRDIDNGDYEIESIIKEALKNAPENSGLTIRLNPQDLENLQNLQNAGQPPFKDITLTADAAVGRAECVIESSRGIINVLIDEHLEQISQALLKTG